MISTLNTYRSASAINSAMTRVYANMFMAVIASMLVSFAVSTSPALMAFFFTGFMKWITIFAPLAAMFLLIPFMNANPPRELARLALIAFASLMGLSFATIFVVYTLGSIVSAFMGAAVLFGTMSFYGYFTKRNLESWGSFLFVGLIAIIIASIINIFIGSTVTAMVISALAIIIFLGLTAYDTQRIREMVSLETENGSAEVLGALSLYLNFINIFLSLLQIFGIKSSD
jgi:FtsH-binding integral membrane protein